MNQLDILEDRWAIQQLNQKYAVHVDLHEIDDWADLFTTDAVFDEREFGTPLATGRDAIRTYGQHLAATVQYALHHMTTHVISDLTTTSARGIAFSTVEALMKDGSHSRFQVIYQDRYEKVDGQWLIAERVLKKTMPAEHLAPPQARPV